MPTIAAMIITVGLVTQFIKVALAKLKIVVEKVWAVVLSVAVSIGVVGYYWIDTEQAFSLNLFVLIIQVAIGANAGYGLLKVTRPQ